MEFLYLIIGILVGFAIGWLAKKPKNNIDTALQNSYAEATNKISALQAQKDILAEQVSSLTTELNQSRAMLLATSTELTKANSDAENLTARLDEQKASLVQLKEQMNKDFENLANKIFEDKSEKFSAQNKTSLDIILNPLKEKIKDFEDKVQKHYDDESREKASLKQQISMLHDLNQQMSKEAHNLTKALKGDSKAQGNWGEFILESVLEKSGLVKDREYVVQASYMAEDGKRYQPDIVINLPESKSIIVDSKVSLVAYEKFIAADDDTVKALAIKEHLQSLRNHLKGLGDKNYQKLYGLQSLDFVLLFIPIEPAFALAVQQDAQLFNDAFERNIVIVSPSTLLATLRTIASIWRQENQNKNAFEIANKAGDLYDKFNGFIEDMLDLGKKMDQSKNSYVDAMKKLVDGRGNLINKVEDLKKMGAKASKSLPQNLLNRSSDE